MNRKELQEQYIDNIVACMDYEALIEIAYDTLRINLSEYTDEQLVAEVEDFFPELLEE